MGIEIMKEQGTCGKERRAENSKGKEGKVRQ